MQALGDTPGDDFAKQVENQRKFREGLQGLLGLGGPRESKGRAHLSTRDDGGRARSLDEFLGTSGATPPASFDWRKFLFGDGAEPGFNFRDHMKIDTGGDNGPQDVSLVGDTAVRVTNPPPRPNINVTINMGGVHGVTDPSAIAGQVAASLESEIRDKMAGLYADSEHSVA